MPGHQDDPFDRIQREVERLFHRLAYHPHPSSHFCEPTWSPAADLVVSESSARVLLELAGVPRGNVRVRLHGRTLEISGRRSTPGEMANAHYHRAEIMFGDFRRTVELPWEADETKVDARYHDGMLEIDLIPAASTERTQIPVEHPSAE